MSKTLVGILQIAVGVALEFVPGFQAVGTSLIISGVTTTVASLLTQTPKPESTETAIKNPVPPRVTAYAGDAGIRLYMAYALYVTAKDGTAVDAGVFHDGRVGAITGYYLGDTKITVLSDGRVQAGDAGQFGELSDIVKVYTRLGLPTETAFSQVIAKVPDQWTTNHRGDGCVTAAVLSAPVSSKNYQMIYPTGGPNQMPLSIVTTGQVVYDWRDSSQSLADPSTWKASGNVIVQLADYLLRFDNKDWATHFAPTLAYWTAAADDCDLPVPLRGVQTVLTDKAPHGSSHLSLSSVNGLATGMTIVVSATGNTSLTETRVVTSISGLVVGFASPLANDHPLGSQVTWTGGTPTEPRYRSCVAFKHTDEHKAVIGNLLACCDGWLSPRADGALIVYSGRYQEPTVEIGPDEILDYTLQDGVEEENAINTLAVTYVSANHDYATVDTDSWTDEDDISARGKALSDTLSNQVPSFSQARRLAKRALSKINAPKRGTTTTNARGRIVRGQRFIRQRIVDAGTEYMSAVVEITKMTRILSTGGVTYEWILADPNVDAWNPATEEGLPAPVGNRVAATPLDAPVVVSVTPTYGQDAGYNTPGVKLTIVAAGPNRADLTWYVRTRPTGGVAWLEQAYPDVDPGASVTLQTDFLPLGQLDVEVSYSTGDGSLSPWAALGDDPIDTGVVLPSALMGLSVSTSSDGTLIAADWSASQFATSYLVEIIPETT